MLDAEAPKIFSFSVETLAAQPVKKKMNIIMIRNFIIIPEACYQETSSPSSQSPSPVSVASQEGIRYGYQ